MCKQKDDPWRVRGIDRELRMKVKHAAERNGMKLGEAVT